MVDKTLGVSTDLPAIKGPDTSDVCDMRGMDQCVYGCSRNGNSPAVEVEYVPAGVRS